MKKTQIVATLAFAFMLGIAMPITQLFNSNHAHAAEQEPGISTPTSDSTAGETTVATVEALGSAIADESITYIQLSSDLTLDQTIQITRDNKLTLDLNGHTISSPNGGAIAIYKGNITLSGTGVIDGGARGNALEIFGATTDVANYSVVNISAGITLKSTNLYGLTVLPAQGQKTLSYGVVVNLAGKVEAPYGISISGNIQHTNNCPQINILDRAEVISTSAEDGTPIYAAGAGQWTVGRATLRGEAAIGVKAGTLTFNNSDVVITGPEQIVNLANGKIIGTGSTFQLEHNPAYADQIVININGGSYSSERSHVFYEYDESTTGRAATVPADINITAGTFRAGPGKNIFSGMTAEQVDIEISGGTFSGEDVSSFKANGYLVGNLIVDANGTVRRPSSHGSSSDAEAPEDPSTPGEPSDPAPTPDAPQGENKVPDTGIVSGHGIIGAVGTIAPLVIASGFAFMFFSGKIHERERQRRLASLESEMNAEVEQIIDESEPEPVMDHFVAVPIARDEPTIAPVDSFISHK